MVQPAIAVPAKAHSGKARAGDQKRDASHNGDVTSEL